MKRLIALVSAVACVLSVGVSSLVVGAADVVDTAYNGESNGYNTVKVEITGTAKADYTVEIAGTKVNVDAGTTAAAAVKQIATEVDKAGFIVHAYYEGAAPTVYNHANAGMNAVVVGTASSSTANPTPIVTGSNPPVKPTKGTPFVLNEVLVCDQNGNPVGFVESGDKNDTDGVKPGRTVYFMVQNKYADLSEYTFDVSKGDNAKHVASVKAVEKKFTTALIDAVGGNAYAPTTGRNTFIAVKLNDNFTDAEYKVSFDMKVKAKVTTRDHAKGDYSQKWESLGTTWVSNQVVEGDTTWTAGEGGYISKPVKNEENEVIWENANRDLARLTFVADSDVMKYYPKLSTKWVDAEYADGIGDADAFEMKFVGNPAISSTSRPVLELYNPFINSDDEYEVSVEDLRIYEIDADGNATEITSRATMGTNDDGDEVITLKTRTLGTYVITDGAALLDTDEVDNVVGDKNEPTTNVKPVPNTGR